MKQKTTSDKRKTTISSKITSIKKKVQDEDRVNRECSKIKKTEN